MDYEFQTSLGYITRLRHQKNKRPEAGRVRNSQSFLLAISWPNERSDQQNKQAVPIHLQYLLHHYYQHPTTV